MRASFIFAALLVASPSWAQHQHKPPGTAPYAGLESRVVKALSDKEIDDLKNGRGMGLALPAELNGYPGPMHVLDLAHKLELSEQQRGRVQELYEAMRREAITLGEKLVSQEAELDREFSTGTITAERLVHLTGEIGNTQGALRASHLRYHLMTTSILVPQQVSEYSKLRGYRQTR
jgi:hypothetical protein